MCIRDRGMEAVLVRSGNCKMTRCRKIESAQEDCPVLSSEYHERMRQECTSRNLEVVKKFDDNGCMTLACASRAEDSCDQQVPDEAYDKCSEQGGKLFVKKDESGCIKFTECVKRGEDEEVYYEKDVKVPETTELLSMAFKLEELKMTFDSLSRKSDAIADYYRSVGSSDESRFRRVADMFGSAGKKVDSIKLGIRDRLDSLTEDSVAEIKKDIKYLKDVMLRDILYLMLSGEEVTEASEQATAETSSDEGCGSDFDCFMRHLRICEHTSFTTSSEAGEVTMTISGLEGETCYLKGVSGDMDMDCMVPDYSLGFENTHDELLPHCMGSLAEKLREVSS